MNLLFKYTTKMKSGFLFQRKDSNIQETLVKSSQCVIRRYSKALYLVLLFVFSLSVFDEGYAFNIAPQATYKAKINQGKDLAYFGYSVGLLKTKTSKYWLLAGAPLANSAASKSVKPGAFYKCPIDKPNEGCEEVVLDITRDFIRLRGDINPFRNNAWTGASFDIDDDGNVMVCSPRWKNAFYPSEYRISGVCYLLGQDLRNNSALFVDSLVHGDYQIYNHHGRNVYYYAHGQCGMDVHFTNNSELLIGLPGVLNWQGSAAKYTRQPNIPVGGINKRETSFIYSKRVIPNPIRTATIQDSDFFGYSVTSGIFDRKYGMYYVSGAPRGASLSGMVLVYLIRDYEMQPLNIKETKQGAQIGEYFGASVSAPDLNGDGLSDLVVGAPMHALEGLYDVGCVYVFMNIDGEEGKAELSTEAVKLLGDISQLARFGTSLGTPGDLDNDGYQDLLVGAPYEKDDSGAVYVFMGSKNGVLEEYQQKLLPEEASPSTPFKGFGISFSRPLDVDENSYPDFAVGSFLSDEAALMSTRPVIVAKGEIYSNPSKLSFDKNFFTLYTCMSYEGKEVLGNMEFWARTYISYESESGEIVADFADSGSTEKLIDFSVSHEGKTCKEFLVRLKLEKSNAQKPVMVRMDFELKNKELKGPENPVMSPHASFPPVLVLSFVTGCKDNLCHSDLSSAARILSFDLGSSLLIGKLPKITLEVTTTNKRDPAFLPYIMIFIPKSIIVLPSSRDCLPTQKIQNVSDTVLECQLKNPLQAFDKDTIRLELDLTQLDDSTPDINITVQSNSSADVEEIPDDNHFELIVKVEKKASIEITGWSHPEQHEIDRIREKKIAWSDTTQVEHRFTITKTGVTPLREVDVMVYLPLNLTLPNGEEIPLMDKIEYTLFHSQSSNCELEYKSKQDRNKTFVNMRQNLNETQETTSWSSQSLSSLSCASRYVSCSTIKCKVGPWRKSHDVATLSVTFNMNLSAINYLLYLKEDGVSLFSFTEVNIASHKDVSLVDGKRYDKASVQTVFYPGSLPAQPLSWWIYLLAILGGLLVLLIITFILYQVGFFKRKTKEELKAQQATLLSQDEE